MSSLMSGETGAHAGTADAATRFKALHEEFFVMPNPWDAGSATLLAAAGFKALASSSAALAWINAKPDGATDRDSAIAHAAMIGTFSGLPVNGDFESGYGATPAEVGETIAAAIDAGIAGCSVEDVAEGGPDPLYDLAKACRRLEAARNAIDRAGSDFVLTGRCEVYFTDAPDPHKIALERLTAYAEVGADVLYAPGVTDPQEVEALVALSRPVNVIAGLGGVSDDLEALKALGVTRISLGSNLIKVALGAFRRSAAALAEGRLDLPGMATSAELNKAFRPA